MAYITKTISKQEKLILLTRLHWIYFVQALIWFGIIVTVGLIADHYFYLYVAQYATSFSVDLALVKFTENSPFLIWLFGLAAFTLTWPQILTYISTEIGVTSERIIHKKGLIFIQVEQFDLEDIRGEDVIHGWLGWALKYGRIHLDCRFVDDVYLPAIPKPYRLVKASHEARMFNPAISYTPDEYRRNLEKIEQRRAEATVKIKMRTLGERTKAKFRAVSNDR